MPALFQKHSQLLAGFYLWSHSCVGLIWETFRSWGEQMQDSLQKGLKLYLHWTLWRKSWRATLHMKASQRAFKRGEETQSVSCTCNHALVSNHRAPLSFPQQCEEKRFTMPPIPHPTPSHPYPSPPRQTPSWTQGAGLTSCSQHFTVSNWQGRASQKTQSTREVKLFGTEPFGRARCQVRTRGCREPALFRRPSRKIYGLNAHILNPEHEEDSIKQLALFGLNPLNILGSERTFVRNCSKKIKRKSQAEDTQWEAGFRSPLNYNTDMRKNNNSHPHSHLRHFGIPS